MIKSLWPPALYASPRVKPPPSPPDVLSPSSPPSLPRYPVRSSPLTTELHGSPRWRADTRHQAEPKPSSHSAAFVFPHPAWGDTKAQEGKQQDASRPGWSQESECQETSKTAHCGSQLGPGPGVRHPQKASFGSAHPNSTRWRRGCQRRP